MTNLLRILLALVLIAAIPAMIFCSTWHMPKTQMNGEVK